ncbi:hypothetical protein RN001_011242 [Aquatica leii]|uniref:Uncharacterized protein n=1 Tax=Aquatica leii TaxID=1421715 RepID=A0AAN7PBP0_9COLE|nr:hypothetical protein RN001_011242 [Aquatica leii]
MAKLAVLVFAVLAFQAVSAERYETYGENKIAKYLDEAKEFSFFLRNDFPEQHLVFKTITSSFQRYAVMVEEMLNKLREESFIKYHDEDKSFKPVIRMLENFYTVLKKMSLYTEMTDKKSFIVDYENLLEYFNEMVHVTYTTLPEFRFTLKYLIVDFMTMINEIRSHFTYPTKTMELTPTTMLMKIREYTHESTKMMKEFTYPIQIKVALRRYVRYVREILYKMEAETFSEDKEFNAIMHSFINKLHAIVFPLMTHEEIDPEVFKTEIFNNFFEIVEVFEKMVHLMKTESMPYEVKAFVGKIFYYYYYTLEMIYSQMKFANKIGFFSPEYYTPEYYPKYGFGLYEKFFKKLYLTPFTYKTQTYSLFPVNKYPVQSYKTFSFEKPVFEQFESPKEFFVQFDILLKEFLVKFETMDVHMFKNYVHEFVQILDVVYEKLRPIHNEKVVEEFRVIIKQMKVYFEEMPIEELKTFFVVSLKMFNSEMYKLEKFEHYLPKDIFVMYTNFFYKMFKHPVKYAFFPEEKMYKDLLTQMHIFTSKIYEIKDFKSVPTMYMRNFITILEQVIDIMHKHIDYKYENKIMHEIFFNLKQMKMDLEQFLYYGGAMSYTYKTRFVQYIKYFTMAMEKMVLYEEFPMMKEVYMRYVNFLQKFYFEMNKYSIEYPVKTYSTMYESKTTMPYFFARYVKY